MCFNYPQHYLFCGYMTGFQGVTSMGGDDKHQSIAKSFVTFSRKDPNPHASDSELLESQLLVSEDRISESISILNHINKILFIIKECD